jgi:hypothetical protein
MSVAVDMNNTIELHAAGIRALNQALGADGAKMFVDQYFGGFGDYTAEKKLRPKTTPEEFDALVELARADAEQRDGE